MSTPQEPQDPYGSADTPPGQPSPYGAPTPGAEPAPPTDPGYPAAPSYPAAPDYGQPSYPAAPDYGQPSYPAAPDYGQPSYPAAPDYGQPSYPGGQQYPGAQQYPAATPYPAAAPYGGQPYGYVYPKNSLGVWSLVLGIAAFALSCGLFTGIPAIIVGNNAKRAVARGEANNGGLATAGVILGWISVGLTILAVLVIIVVAIAGGFSASVSSS